ncbi:MAG: SoxR reducing system RseC family protein [Christensenellaceae bacterium]|nr:SoxR reducing system RseC family protein [Christensenellaceae bacterium]
MNETGTVTKLKRGNATVSFDRKSACDQCRMCAVSKSGKTVEVVLPNTLNAGIGDKVEVTMGSRYVLTAAVVVYVIPLILVVIGVFAFQTLGEIAQIIASVVALFIGLALAVVLDKFVIRKKKGFVPEMTRIVLRAGEEECEEENVEEDSNENKEPSEDGLNGKENENN